jgi:cobalt-zinc-cadmium efflux system outer membrane protein
MMKTRTIFSLFLVTGTVISIWAQVPSPDTLMKKVLENNRTLKVARESYQVAILEAGTGNTPPDPEVEFGYLFGKPSDMGNRLDFSVSQQVEFPTVYIHKSRLRKIRTTQAELEYVISRQEVLLQAQQLWIMRLHLNQQEQLMLKRLRQAETINDHFRKKLDSGEESPLTYSQSNLQLAALQSEYEQVVSEIRGNQLSLNEISGGLEIDIKDTIFPAPIEIVPDSLLMAYLNSPAMQLHHRELQLKEEQKGLTVGQNLPKISAGYYSESVLDQQFKGFQVGVTVPLWENSNRIKKAKSEVIFAEADAERYTYLQKKEVMQNLDQLESLKSRAHHLEEALGTGKSIELLILALNTGEISLSEYFYASDFYFRNTQLLLQFKKDQLFKEAELLKVYL